MHKNAYLLKKDDYFKIKQHAGAFALYMSDTRFGVDHLREGGQFIPAIRNLITQAFKKKRYYVNRNDGSPPEGIHSASGKGADPKIFTKMDVYKKDNNVTIDIDQYESTLIWKKLEEMNRIIPKDDKSSGIQTIQSGVAYYDYDKTFGDRLPYLQKPFVEFCADPKYWEIAKWITKKLYDTYGYNVTVFYDPVNAKHNYGLRFCIIRPYYVNGEYIKEFDDTDFFNNVINCLKEAKNKIGSELKLSEPENDLDAEKKWYILSEKGNILLYKLDGKGSYVNPYDGKKLSSDDKNVFHIVDSWMRYLPPSTNLNNISYFYIQNEKGDILPYKLNNKFVHPDTGQVLTSLNVRYTNELEDFKKPL
jgi:hypothetical protein